jgi:hypothetical protein
VINVNCIKDVIDHKNLFELSNYSPILCVDLVVKCCLSSTLFNDLDDAIRNKVLNNE